MPTRRAGSIHLFRFAGIDVFLHWSWFLVALFEIQGRHRNYSSLVWNVAEYLAVFLIVLMHEFGHSLACRQVGGAANTIVLWPLGGVAFVSPPQRPGATLWSIAAGPLVNVALLPLLYAATTVARVSGWAVAAPDAWTFVRTLFVINFVLLAFNLLPIYPLDGGQILRSLFWFFLGRARSLFVASILGFVALVAALGWALWSGSLWNAFLAYFLLANCWRGLQSARRMMELGEVPRREGLACPNCHTAPPYGEFWRCPQCGQPSDPFTTGATCRCGAQFFAASCPHCGETHPIGTWMVPFATQSTDATA